MLMNSDVSTQIAEFCIFCNISYVLSKRLNFTRLIKESFNPEFYHQYTLLDKSVVRDLSYLPEKIYDDEHEATGIEVQHLNRDNRNLMLEYRNLCETVTKRVEIDDSDYEYLPSHYHEVFCKSNSLLNDDMRMTRLTQQKCVHPGFHCIQKYRILSLVRRRWVNECWEPYTKEIASGCDCMWPVSTLGEITAHY